MRKQKDTGVDGISLYQFNNPSFPEESSEIHALLQKFREISDIFNNEKKRPDISSNSQSHIQEHIKQARDIQKRIEAILEAYDISGQKNILRGTNTNDILISNGKDSRVYPLLKDYVYKEGKVSSPENVLFLKNKYSLLKKYLGLLIPKSAFVYGESMMRVDSSIKKYRTRHIPQNISLTIQRRIKGKDLSQMTIEEKQDPVFLNKLLEGHRKYILLKMFLRKIQNQLHIPEKSMELKLDLGFLSNKDNIDIQNIDLPSLNCPNIMWDGENIYFIDFDSGTWDEEKQKIYEKMMEPSILISWQKVLEIYNMT